MAYPTLIAYPAANLGIGATWSAPAGTIDSAFPLTNQNSVYAHLVTKFTGTSGTLRGTIASTAIQALVLINCSRSIAGLTGTVTNNGGMASQNIVVPAQPADGCSINAWVDLRSVTTAGTQWDVAFSGASSAIGIGKVLLIDTLREMPIRLFMPAEETKPTHVFRTEADIALGNRIGVRYRTWIPTFPRESYRTVYTQLRRAAEGPTQPFLFVFDATLNDPAYAWFPDPTWRQTYVFDGHTEWADRLEEANPGQAL